MPTQSLTLTWSDGANPITKKVPLTANSNDGREIVVEPGTQVFIDLAFAKANLAMIYVVTDVDVVLKVNDITGGQEFSLEPDKPFSWYEGSGLPNPFSPSSVEGIWLENATTGDATVKLQALFNQ